MNSKKKENYFQISRKNLFLQMEDCKTKINNDINKKNYENSKTYDDYHWRKNLKSNNSQNKTDDDILNNEFNSSQKNENQNKSFVDKINNNISYNKESPNVNINKTEIMTIEEKNSKVKQFFDNDNKTKKEEDIIQNISAIENKSSITKQNELENKNIENKENMNNNDKKKPLIHEPNILGSTKIQVLKQKINNRNNKNKQNVDKIKTKEEKGPNIFHKKSSKNINADNFLDFNNNKNNNNKIKNKLYYYLTNMEDGASSNNSRYHYNNIRLSLINRKIMNKNKFENINDSARTSRLSYVGFKRYQNISLSNLSQIKKGIDSYYMINNNIKKANNLKRKINYITNMDNANNVNKNHKLYDILKKNKGIEDMFKTKAKPSINNKDNSHYNKILDQLNKTIEKLSKNETNLEIEKTDINKTFGKFSYTRLNETSPIKKNKKNKITLFEKVNLTKTNNNDINYKKNKLLFESKMNNMNNTINQLLKKTPEIIFEKRVTFPANNFRKTKSISKIYNNSRKNSRVLLI